MNLLFQVALLLISWMSALALSSVRYKSAPKLTERRASRHKEDHHESVSLDAVMNLLPHLFCTPTHPLFIPQ